MAEEPDVSRTEQLLERLERGDTAALEALVALHRPYLRRLVELRLEEPLRARIDPSDIVQETQLTATQRIDDFLRRRPTSFRLWLRRKALEELANQRRRHVQAAKRSVRREQALSEASSLALAGHIAAVTPSKIEANREMAVLVRQAVERMKADDREILLLRHLEELSNAEAAELLEITEEAAKQRHGRAFRRLCEQLAGAGLLSQVERRPPA